MVKNMKINSVNNYTYNKSSSNPNFGWGLTQFQIDKANNMTRIERKKRVRNLRRSYGMRADVRESNAVACCLEIVAETMKNAGFELPSRFSYKKFNPIFALGHYLKWYDEIDINAYHYDFSSLERQNKFEELGGEPGCLASKHFLNTYFHEFSHAAHYKNIVKNYGKTKGRNIYWNTLSEMSPNSIIKKPIITYFERILPQNDTARKFFENIENLIPFKNSDLDEYFADLNALRLAEKLGENCAISEINSDFIEAYKPLPDNYNVKKEVLNNPQKAIKDIIQYFNSNIWNGNVENIETMTNFLNGNKKYII